MFSETGAAWVAAAVAVGAFVLTILQTRIAKAAVDHAKEVHLDQMQPYVFADIRSAEHTKGLAMLVVCNEGPTVATYVHIKFSRPLVIERGPDDPPLGEWKIKSLPPGAQFVRPLGAMVTFLGSNGDSPVQVTVDAHGLYSNEKLETLTYELDLPQLKKTSAAGKTISHAAEALESMAKTLKAANPGQK